MERRKQNFMRKKDITYSKKKKGSKWGPQHACAGNGVKKKTESGFFIIDDEKCAM